MEAHTRRTGAGVKAEGNNHRIQKFTSSGTFLLKWGSLGSADGQLIYPRGVAVDASGNVYVAEASTTASRSSPASSGCRVTTRVDGAGNAVTATVGVAVNATTNRIYVANVNSGTVSVIAD